VGGRRLAVVSYGVLVGKSRARERLDERVGVLGAALPEGRGNVIGVRGGEETKELGRSGEKGKDAGDLDFQKGERGEERRNESQWSVNAKR